MSEPTRDQKARLSIADVAKLAEVDRSVVSRVLSNDANLKIREETRRRVKEVVARVGYRPNPLARSLRTQKAGALALLLPDFADPLFGAIAMGAEAEAASRGLVLVVARPGPDGVEGQVERIGAGRVDGFLVAAGDLPPAAQRRLDRAGVAWLRLLTRGASSSRRYLILDDGAAAAAGVRHLAELGHRRMALAGVEGESGARGRDGFLRAVKQAGLEGEAVDDPAAVFEGRSRPTGVVAGTARAGAAMVRSASELGLEVPGDLSIVSLQDLPPAADLAPPLTAIRTPLEELGRRAVELLASLTADQSVREVLDVPAELVVRGSAARPRRP